MTTVAPLTYSPYDYAIHEDPYPTYTRLRAEAPVFYNEELDFFAYRATPTSSPRSAMWTATPTRTA